ncbi:biopolymer transporter Tol [Microbacteriaceae bacterium VKM Ac-2854]|nr:biopolymer transporter Tol [Microbacteriaceae bacterium VKM Ac-2854]
MINGRRWRRTDPALPDGLVATLQSYLGRGRSAVRLATDEDAVAEARRRVDLAKHALGERGPRWWERAEADRLAQARSILAELEDGDERLSS